MEVYFISSSVLQSSHFNFYGAILKLNVKIEKMADYSTPPKKAKRSLSGAATIKVDSRRMGQNYILYLKYKIHRENFVAMFVPVLCIVLTKVKQI